MIVQIFILSEQIYLWYGSSVWCFDHRGKEHPESGKVASFAIWSTGIWSGGWDSSTIMVKMETISSKNEWNEPPGFLHVFPVLFSKEADAFRFIGPCGEVEQYRGSQSQSTSGDGWNFEEDSPCEQEQGTVKRVTDVTINAGRNQRRGFLKSQQGWLSSALSDRFPAAA